MSSLELTPDEAADALGTAELEVVGRMRYSSNATFLVEARVDGMELAEIAGACGVSLATIKRRIKSAEADFAELGQAHEALAEWFEDLAWKPPLRRKPWQHEPHNTVIFDALATAVVFLAGP